MLRSCFTDMAASHVLLLILGLGQCLAILDKTELVQVTKFSRDVLATDVARNRRNEQQRRKETEAFARQILKQVDKRSRDQADLLQESLQDMVTTMTKNMKEIVHQNKISHNLLHNLSQENEAIISKAITNSSNTFAREVGLRMKQHEQLLETSVEACGENEKHRGRGIVNMNIRSLNEARVGGVEKEKPLSSGGYFTVPEGGEGTYKIAYSMIMDTVSDSNRGLHNPSYFTLKLSYGGHSQILTGSQVTTTVGEFNKDLVPASRELLVDLRGGESVYLFQETRRAGLSYKITFCAHLVKPILVPGAKWESISSFSFPDLNRTPTNTYNGATTEKFHVSSHNGSLLMKMKMPDLLGIRSPRHPFMKFARPFPGGEEEDETNLLELGSSEPQAQELGDSNGHQFLEEVDQDGGWIKDLESPESLALEATTESESEGSGAEGS